MTYQRIDRENVTQSFNLPGRKSHARVVQATRAVIDQLESRCLFSLSLSGYGVIPMVGDPLPTEENNYAPPSVIKEAPTSPGEIRKIDIAFVEYSASVDVLNDSEISTNLKNESTEKSDPYAAALGKDGAHALGFRKDALTINTNGLVNLTGDVWGWAVNYVGDVCGNSVRNADGAINVSAEDFESPAGESGDGPQMSFSNGSYASEGGGTSFGDGMNLDLPSLSYLGVVGGEHTQPGANYGQTVDGDVEGLVIGIVKSGTSATIAMLGIDEIGTDGKWVTSSATQSDSGDSSESNRPSTETSVTNSSVAPDVFKRDGHEYVYTEGGTTYRFADFSETAHPKGVLLSKTSATGSSMIATWDSSGRLATLQYTYPVMGSAPTVDVYTFSYDSTSSRVARVVQARNTADIRTVDYQYYTGTETGSAANGPAGSLKRVTKHKGSGTGPVIGTRYYRWYTGNGTDGYAGGLKMVLSDDGYARALNHYGTTTALETATDSGTDGIANFAENYIKYDMSVGALHTADGKPRVREIISTSAGAGCSCGKSGQGAATYAYEPNPSSTATGANAWANKTTITMADGSQSIVYTNSDGQTILDVTKDVVQSKEYLSWNQYDANGKVIRHAEGRSLTGYLASNPDLVGFGLTGTGNKFAANARIDVTSYFAQSDDVDPALYDYVKSKAVQVGTAISITESYTYKDGALIGDEIYYVATDTTYPVEGSLSSSRVTSYDYALSQDDNGAYTSQPKSIATSLVNVSASQHGADGTASGSSSANYKATTIYDSAGRTVWTVDAGGYINYYAYDPLTGAKTKEIDDVDPASVSNPSVTGPARIDSLPAAQNLTTTIICDDQGRTLKVTDPNGNLTYTVYDDTTDDGTPRRVVTYPGWRELRDPATQAVVGYTTTGPVHATIDDPATGITDTVTYSWSASTGLPTYTSGSLTGFPSGQEDFNSGNFHLQSLFREIRNVSGQRIESRQFTSFSGLTYVPGASGWESLGKVMVANQVVDDTSKVLSTKYKYDVGGRLYQTTTPDGTITTTVHDARGLVLSEWKGTNNAGATNVDMVETHLVGTGSGNNMLKVASYTYDDDGNQLTATRYADATHSYTTTSGYDMRGRLANARGPDGIATHYTYDNLGEQTQAERYVDADGDLVMDGGESIGNTTSSYDDQGRVYQTSTYQGSRVPDALGSDDGSVAKVSMPGHGFVTGQSVKIAGASQSAYNGTFTITKISDDQFSFTPGGSLATTATPLINGRLTVTATKRLTTGYWYDLRGNLVKTLSPSGLINKSFYDATGRVTRTTLSADSGEAAFPTFAKALSLSADKVIEQNDTYYDKGGRARIVTNWKRDGADASSTGAATAGAFDHTAVAYYYDAADRLRYTADFGRDGAEAATTPDRRVWAASGASYLDTNSNGIPDVIDTVQDADPGLSNPSSATGYNWIYSAYGYNDAGNLSVTYGNTLRNAFTNDDSLRQTRYAYDLAGRRTKMVENYVKTAVVGGVTVSVDPGPRAAVNNYSDVTPAATETDTNRTTLYGYDGWGRLSTQTALNPQGSGNGVQQQVTQFAYGSDFDRSYVTATLYGDAVASGNTSVTVDGTGKGTVGGTAAGDAVYNAYDRLGRKTNETDQRGVVHTYAYDAAGRLDSDSVSGDPPMGYVNTTAKIAYGYDDQSRLTRVTSKNTSNATLNEVGFTYDAWGNVIRDVQAHDGAVVGNTPFIRYDYDDGSYTGVEAQYVRLRSTTYPAVRDANNNSLAPAKFTTDYGTGEVDAALVRSIGVSDDYTLGTGIKLRYTYLGLGQIIKSSRLQVANGLNQTAGTAADDYSGLDRYGRWKRLIWTNDTADRRTEDRIYTYDRTGNRLSMNNVPNGNASVFDETYTYDGLDRLTAFHRGTLSGGAISSANETVGQSWTLDALGNWRLATLDSRDYDYLGYGSWTTAERSVNAANEITGETGTDPFEETAAVTPSYDAAGNAMTAGMADNMSKTATYAYDAWNRMATASLGTVSPLIESMEYDGLGRFIEKRLVNPSTSTGSTEHYYYNEAGQVVQVNGGTLAGAQNAAPRERTLWDASYVNAAAQVELDNNSDGTVDRRLYPTWDANYNVTALVAPHGRSVERYVRLPYGNSPATYNGLAEYAGTTTVLYGQETYNGNGDPDGADWTVDYSGTDYTNFKLGFQGMRWDTNSRTYVTMSRRYLPGQGTFAGRDPLGVSYQDGYNLYAFVTSNPITWVDPSGLEVKVEKKSVLTDQLKTGRIGETSVKSATVTVTLACEDGKTWKVDSVENLLTIETRILSEELLASRYARDPLNPTRRDQADGQRTYGEVRRYENLNSDALAAAWNTADGQYSPKIGALEGKKDEVQKKAQKLVDDWGQQFASGAAPRFQEDAKASNRPVPTTQQVQAVVGGSVKAIFKIKGQATQPSTQPS